MGVAQTTIPTKEGPDGSYHGRAGRAGTGRVGGRLPVGRLGEVEQKVREVVLRVGAKAVELHLAGKPLGYEGSSRACACGRDQKFVAHRPRTLATLLGQVTLERAYYHCPRCGSSCCPYDQ